MHKFIVLVLAMFFTACSTTRVNSRTLSPPTKSFVKIIHTTEVISCYDPNDKECPIGIHRHSGSGAAILIVANEMTVLTAGHVCDSQPTAKIEKYSQSTSVIDHEGTMHQAWPIAVSFNNNLGSSDLCILWVPTLETKKIMFSLTPPKVGEELYYMGAPMGVYHPPTVPIFKGVYSGPVDASSAMITAPAAGGSSGGPVLNKDNKVVGIIFAVNQHFHHISLMTNHRSFLLFLEQAKKKLKERQ